MHTNWCVLIKNMETGMLNFWSVIICLCNGALNSLLETNFLMSNDIRNDCSFSPVKIVKLRTSKCFLTNCPLYNTYVMCQKVECFLYLLQIFDFHQRPVLACAFQDPIHVWSGCLDGKLKSFDINSNQESVIGMHENTIRCIEFSNEINAVRDFLSI